MDSAKDKAREAHRKAMELDDKALAAIAKGHRHDAIELLYKAASLEMEAVQGAGCMFDRQVLMESAASMRAQARKLREGCQRWITQ